MEQNLHSSTGCSDNPAPAGALAAPGSPVPGRASIVIPVLDEAQVIGDTLERLQVLRAAGHEVIVVDGGSNDATVERATGMADLVLRAPRGRAAQMNAGATAARGELFVFLHADTQLPEAPPRGPVDLALRGLAASGRCWGRFDVHIEGGGLSLAIVAALMNLRSRCTGIATGDQAIFVRRDAFEAAGGFPQIALMEDVALSAKLRRRSRPLCLRVKALTSGRRWRSRGILRTILLMWWLRLRYFLGASPETLERRYHER